MKKIEISITPAMYSEEYLLFRISKRGRSFIAFACKTKILSMLTESQRPVFLNSKNLLFEVKKESFKKTFPDVLIK